MQDGRWAVTLGLEETLRPGDTTIGMPFERVNGRRVVRTNAMSVSGFPIIILKDGGRWYPIDSTIWWSGDSLIKNNARQDSVRGSTGHIFVSGL